MVDKNALSSIVRKGMRFQKPIRTNIQLRPEVYQFLSDISCEAQCGVSVLIRGILEDVYDRYRDLLDQEAAE